MEWYIEPRSNVQGGGGGCSTNLCQGYCGNNCFIHW